MNNNNNMDNRNNTNNNSNNPGDAQRQPGFQTSESDAALRALGVPPNYSKARGQSFTSPALPISTEAQV
jgi:hypothetical protein